jgi:hypothetical protein
MSASGLMRARTTFRTCCYRPGNLLKRFSVMAHAQGEVKPSSTAPKGKASCELHFPARA